MFLSPFGCTQLIRAAEVTPSTFFNFLHKLFTGAFMFATDLFRACEIPKSEIAFIRFKSYEGTSSTGGWAPWWRISGYLCR